MKFGQNVYLGEIWVGIVFWSSGSKTRSLGQIIEKPCVDNRGHSFHPIFMKFGQNVYLDEILVRIVFGIVFRSNNLGSQLSNVMKFGHYVKSSG